MRNYLGDRERRGLARLTFGDGSILSSQLVGIQPHRAEDAPRTSHGELHHVHDHRGHSRQSGPVPYPIAFRLVAKGVAL